MSNLPYVDITTIGPVFVPGQNVFTAPIRFEAVTDAVGPHGGMGNVSWTPVINPLYDAADPMFAGLTDRDFPGFIPDPQPSGAIQIPGPSQGAYGTPQVGNLYGPRQYAQIISDSWRFNWNGTFYHVTSSSVYDIDHPLTGEDFGYVMWSMGKGSE